VLCVIVVHGTLCLVLCYFDLNLNQSYEWTLMCLWLLTPVTSLFIVLCVVVYGKLCLVLRYFHWNQLCWFTPMCLTPVDLYTAKQFFITFTFKYIHFTSLHFPFFSFFLFFCANGLLIVLLSADFEQFAVTLCAFFFFICLFVLFHGRKFPIHLCHFILKAKSCDTYNVTFSNTLLLYVFYMYSLVYTSMGEHVCVCLRRFCAKYYSSGWMGEMNN
jgi:hypothetical protein